MFIVLHGSQLSNILNAHDDRSSARQSTSVHLITIMLVVLRGSQLSDI